VAVLDKALFLQAGPLPMVSKKFHIFAAMTTPFREDGQV
jgi:hypothetical protein